jgi:hypothetical protein
MHPSRLGKNWAVIPIQDPAEKRSKRSGKRGKRQRTVTEVVTWKLF